MTTTPTGTVICEGDTQDGYHYIVRDTGLFDIVGNNLCSWMLHPTPGFGNSSVSMPTPTPELGVSATFPPGLNMCAVGVVGHDVVAEFDNSSSARASESCNQLLAMQSYYFVETGQPSWQSMPIVCQSQGTTTITVYDDGGQFYGTEMCKELGIATQ